MSMINLNCSPSDSPGISTKMRWASGSICIEPIPGTSTDQDATASEESFFVMLHDGEYISRTKPRVADVGEERLTGACDGR
jgi:hypothetical protein